jgi:yecA family protein
MHVTTKAKTDKLVFDIHATSAGTKAWRVLAMSADATLVDLHLALLGAFDWAGDYLAAESIYCITISAARYEGGAGSRSALRRVLAAGTTFRSEPEDANLPLQCEVLRSYEVPSRRHYPKVLEADDPSVLRTATWLAQAAARRQFLEQDATLPRRVTPTTRAYRHGFFSAVIAGPMVMPTEWMGRFYEKPAYQSLEELNAELARSMEEYNAVASALFELPQQYVDDVVAVCTGDRAPPQGLIDWFRGFRDAMALRAAEWHALIAGENRGDLFTPFYAMEDMLETPGKRAWLDDPELQRNLPRALGIVARHVWELSRQHGSS